MAHRRRIHILSVLTAGVSYGAVTPLVKHASMLGIPIALLTVWQYPVALMVLMVARRIVKSSPIRLSFRSLGSPVGVGLGMALTSLCYYQSLTHLPPEVAVLLLFQFSWILPCLGWIARRQRPTGREIGPLVLVVMGTLVAVGVFSPLHITFVGVAEGLGAALGYALTLFFQARTHHEVDVFSNALITVLVAFLCVALFYHVWSGLAEDLAPSFLYGSAAGIVSLMIPLLLLYVSAAKLGDTLTSILASVELPAALILSLIWLHTPISVIQWLGTGMIITGIALGARLALPVVTQEL